MSARSILLIVAALLITAGSAVVVKGMLGNAQPQATAPAKPVGVMVMVAKTDIPTRAKAVFIDKENQLSSPATVPTPGPMLRIIAKQSPPAFGMAVVISAMLSIPGSDRRPAKR